jgi:glycerol-3-phosphate acyltransferase PlsX
VLQVSSEVCSLHIGIDLTGGESSPHVLFEAVIRAAELLHSANSFVVFATQSVIEDLQVSYTETLQSPTGKRIEFYSVSDIIAMSDEPLFAVRHKKKSSIVLGIRLMKKRQLDAFVSAGNTGALITSATLQLPKLPGVKRLALLAVMPTLTGSVAVLDVGGNVSCKPQHLMQFAQMGAAYQSCCEGIENPRVGLLNIGVEPKKGTSAVRQAYQELEEFCRQDCASSEIKMKFIGNIEGREVFQGGVDVVVTDGFTGNVLLKTSEGIAAFIFDYIKEAVSSKQAMTSEKLQQTFHDLQRYFSSSEYPGAILCGVEGIVIKCHGNASAHAMFNSIKGAVTLVEKQFVEKIKEQL